MPPINANNQVENRFLLNGIPQESNRAYYNQRVTVLIDKILNANSAQSII